MFFLVVVLLRRAPIVLATDSTVNGVSYPGICTHLADARCHADVSRSYNRRISSMEDGIIIGGGPVGFINALGLAQAGVRVSVIEAEPHIILESDGSQRERLFSLAGCRPLER